jgi:hypothetical protein
MGLRGEKDSLGIIPERCVMKKIRIFSSYQELEFNQNKTTTRLTGTPDSAGKQLKTLKTRFYVMDDLSESQKTIVGYLLKSSAEYSVTFYKNGIFPGSYQFLDKISELLMRNPDIRLEMGIHTGEEKKPGETIETSEKWAQELNFYFRNKNVGRDVFHTRGFDLSRSGFKPVLSEFSNTEGEIEFIFMKN